MKRYATGGTAMRERRVSAMMEPMGWMMVIPAMPSLEPPSQREAAELCAEARCPSCRAVLVPCIRGGRPCFVCRCRDTAA